MWSKGGSQSILTVKDDLVVHIQNLLKVIKDTDVLLDKNEELQVLDDLRNTIAGFKRYQYFKKFMLKTRILNEQLRKTLLNGLRFRSEDIAFYESLYSLDREDVPIERIIENIEKSETNNNELLRKTICKQKNLLMKNKLRK